jgi:hypothetical protein
MLGLTLPEVLAQDALHASLSCYLHHEARRPRALSRFAEGRARRRRRYCHKRWADWEKANAASFPDKDGMVGKTKCVSTDGIAGARNEICG